jgi:dihydrofolate reductase
MSRRDGNATGSRVTLHVVSSLDGFIAKKDNSVSWLDSPGKVYEAGVSISEEEIAAFIKSIDCYVLGSRTYEHALELGWPYGDTPVVVVSGRLCQEDAQASCCTKDEGGPFGATL